MRGALNCFSIFISLFLSLSHPLFHPPLSSFVFPFLFLFFYLSLSHSAPLSDPILISHFSLSPVFPHLVVFLHGSTSTTHFLIVLPPWSDLLHSQCLHLILTTTRTTSKLQASPPKPSPLVAPTPS